MTKKEQLLSDLKEIVKPYIQNQEAFENLAESTDFINDLKINSANLVDIVLDIEIDNDSMDQMLNVRAAIKIIEEKLTKE